MSLPHMACRDATVGGYTVPKGAWVVPFIYSCHHDYETWGDPGNFRPERWIDDKGALVKQQAFMPFSAGMCMIAGLINSWEMYLSHHMWLHFGKDT